MTKRLGSAADLFGIRMLIYELHVRVFKDSKADRIGYFSTLIQKIDYLQDLGIACLWHLPFFTFPLKDDGYAMSDYLNVHPMYGTIDNFREFLAAAQDGSVKVMIELVVNHTSDQHPWLQAARRAPRSSPERDFYVWNDTEERYKDAIVVSDRDRSNWTWDSLAKQYYGHRFFSHQPDLNYEKPHSGRGSPENHASLVGYGAYALCLDAIPYLVEREGSTCENLAETHAVIKALRREIDAGYSNTCSLLTPTRRRSIGGNAYFGSLQFPVARTSTKAPAGGKYGFRGRGTLERSRRLGRHVRRGSLRAPGDCQFS